MSPCSSLHGDGPCSECGTTENIVWFTDNTLWNNAVRFEWIGAEDDPQDTYAEHRWGGEPILCLPCFIKVVEDRGYRPVAWRVVPEWPWKWEPEKRSRAT